MRAREQNLTRILAEAGWRETPAPPRARMDALPVDAQDVLAETYRALGGRDPLPVRTGPWDMAFDSLVIEFDEEQHFNRYRHATLALSRELPWHQAYLGHCKSFEDECDRKGRRGGYWTNSAAEKMFGPAGPRGELDGLGSPRWKQRAIYDAMRDMTTAHGGVRMARLSMYDVVDGVLLGQALEDRKTLNSDALVALIDQRTVG